MVGWQGSCRSRGAQHRSGWIQRDGSMDGQMDKRMAGESLCGPIILITGEGLTPPSAPEVKKKTSTFSNSFATRGLCEKQIPLIRRPMNDVDGGTKAEAVCQLWHVVFLQQHQLSGFVGVKRQ